MWNQLKTITLLGVLSALVVGIGGAVAPSSLWLFVGLAAATNLFAWFFSDTLVLRLHGAREVSRAEAPALHALVSELAEKAELPMPKLYVLPEAQPNAFATGRNPSRGAVAVTEGLMQALTRRELRGVLAHELAHIKHRDILVSSVAATLAAAVTSIAHALSFASLFGGRSDDEETSPAGGLFLALVAPVAATLVQLGISRSREYLADEEGARLTGDPEALASALLKLEHSAQEVPAMAQQPATASLFIVNPFAGAGALMGLFSTHPSTAERVKRLLALAESGVGSHLGPTEPWRRASMGPFGG